jgi:hypothetical protein
MFNQINKICDKLNIRVVIFLLFPWVVGVVLAFWFGLGWFFLLEALHRCLIAVPQVYIPLLRRIVGVERAEEEKRLLDQKNVRLFYIWRIVVAAIWIIVAVVVFFTVNIRLVSLFQ